MEKKHHTRSDSHGRKLQLQPTQTKPSRPAHLHKRQQSYNNALPQGNAVSSSGKPALGPNRKAATEVLSQDDEETGMASFLQFCATCEKQIVTPGSSILYCSAACRRNDVSRAQPIQELHSPSILPTAASYFDPPPMDIVPQRSPTMARPLSLSSDLSLSDYEYMQGDHSSGYPSEALRFLSQFHSHDYSIDQPSRPKPRPNRTSTATESSSIPSLINTPSSSYGTAGSQSSYGYRPLPPRHDPLTGHRHTKSTDLVIPMFSAPASASPDQASMNSSVSTLTATKPSGTDEIDFARQSRRQRRSETASGSLKKLFSHEAMQASPCDR